MEKEKEILEYELIDICIDSSIYEEREETAPYSACDVVEGDKPAPEIKYDADGIPMGDSQEERLIRREKIHQFIQRWREQHSDNPRVFNENLNECIKINQVFLLESVLHSAMRYQSTKAVMKMEIVMAKAILVGEVRIKEGNSNQKPFEKMIVMRYDSGDLGAVKMTVGVRRRTLEKVEYCITVPENGIPFIDETLKRNVKSKKRKKHHK